jgi:hypothetical protein
MNLVRRVRGFVGMMSVWAVVFGVTGTAWPISLALFGALPDWPYPFGIFLRILAQTFALFGSAGAAMGFTFATAVLLGERKRALVALSPRRFAAWGFLAAAIVPMGFATFLELTGRSSDSFNLRVGLIFAGICGATGATLAAATLRAARRAPVSLDDENPHPRVPAG